MGSNLIRFNKHSFKIICRGTNLFFYGEVLNKKEIYLKQNDNISNVWFVCKEHEITYCAKLNTICSLSPFFCERIWWMKIINFQSVSIIDGGLR
jgi:hypothetical protein